MFYLTHLKKLSDERVDYWTEKIVMLYLICNSLFLKMQQHHTEELVLDNQIPNEHQINHTNVFAMARVHAQ